MVHSNRLSCLPGSGATVLRYGVYEYFGVCASLGLACYLSVPFGGLRRVPARNLGSRALSQTSSTAATFNPVDCNRHYRNVGVSNASTIERPQCASVKNEKYIQIYI